MKSKGKKSYKTPEGRRLISVSGNQNQQETSARKTRTGKKNHRMELFVTDNTNLYLSFGITPKNNWYNKINFSEFV